MTTLRRPLCTSVMQHKGIMKHRSLALDQEENQNSTYPSVWSNGAATRPCFHEQKEKKMIKTGKKFYEKKKNSRACGSTSRKKARSGKKALGGPVRIMHIPPTTMHNEHQRIAPAKPFGLVISSNFCRQKRRGRSGTMPTDPSACSR